ncbi:MAG: Uma2 family endonuclease [Acidobacteriota bacterium]|nr:Uma2 family endonuclease [Acidobacteriota bacterium]
MPTTTKWITYEDSLTMPENRFEEIVDGESRIMPPPTRGHWRVLNRIHRTLIRQLTEEEHEISRADVGLGIKRRPVLTYRIPDIAVFSVSALVKDQAENPMDENYIWTPPEFIAECLSPSNRKGQIERLREDYESINVPELWFIDPRSRTLTIFLLERNSLVAKRTVENGVISPVRLPQVNVNIDDLWRAFDF